MCCYSRREQVSIRLGVRRRCSGLAACVCRTSASLRCGDLACFACQIGLPTLPPREEGSSASVQEVMLMAEGFQLSRMLSRKFVILYKLCEDLLSKSQHYDWKLRAIKTTLYVAGGMRRASPDLSEDKVR